MDLLALPPNLRVLLGTSLLGCVAGVIGSLAVLRRRSLTGDMVAHAAMPGLCLAYLVAYELGIGRDRPAYFLLLMSGAALTGLIGSALVTFLTRWTRTRQDAAIGIVLSTFFGAFVVLLSYIRYLPGAHVAGVDQYIFGQAATLLTADVWFIAGVLLVSIVTLAICFKELKTYSFDADFAHSLGWPTLSIDLGMMAALCLVTVVGLPLVGILMAGMIIIPCAAARFWTYRFGPLLVISGAIGAATGVFATLVSAEYFVRWFGFDPLAFGYNRKALPTGPVIILSGAAIFLASVLFAPRRGVLARLIALLRLRSRTATENLLRALYELGESQLPRLAPHQLEEIQQHRRWNRGQLTWALRRATWAGWIERNADAIQLTASGHQRAAEVTRIHRLWELFLISGARIAPDHVDRDADSIEHVLTPNIVGQLEAMLAESGRLPRTAATPPQSPHVLTGGNDPVGTLSPGGG
ncbi:MAG: hypothetical protein DWQ31_19065 [Planctomycetota bacterium]|nr:MAG: hypothetical protein DWQ31_19065 [Planctomycetota bacterium]REJ96029.1 MAG: hypothetical protein DWQ35_05365 [Planctomycetota bacterium]REK25477.1 MAG: hypothetical protein DWQ42_11255 [Planctomycetota bacterium]REK40487.1 MAG: hypothetical protein DWQ46_16230 [Planctomycetota bacterium]